MTEESEEIQTLRIKQNNNKIYTIHHKFLRLKKNTKQLMKDHNTRQAQKKREKTLSQKEWKQIISQIQN